MQPPTTEARHRSGGAEVAAVLVPAVTEAARRAGASTIGLVDVGSGAGLALQIDRVGIAYDNGQFLGDPSSPVQLAAAVRGGRRLPEHAVPEVVARTGTALDPVDGLPDALARVPVGALPVVTTTWALSRLSVERRLRFLQRLDEEAARRPVAWVSVEGVGVAPAVPTLGDRHASGHSLVGLAVLDGSTLRAETVGRCWSRGRWLSWLAEA